MLDWTKGACSLLISDLASLTMGLHWCLFVVAGSPMPPNNCRLFPPLVALTLP